MGRFGTERKDGSYSRRNRQEYGDFSYLAVNKLTAELQY